MENAKPYSAVRDVSDSSFGTSNLDFTRSRITPTTANKQFPYRAAGKLFFQVPGQGNFVCSASVIARRLVLTAAHCMFTNGVGFHTNWLYVPGYDGTKPVGPDRSPFGEWTWARAEVPIQWINSGGALPNNEDFGILVTNDLGGNSILSQTGRFVPATGHLFDTHVSMLGYPCNFDSCNIMQRNDSSDHRLGAGTAYEYGSDMTGGSSGGPWVENLGAAQSAPPTGGFAVRNTVVAVTSYVYNDPAVRVLGASQLNANFTTIRNNSCAAAAGNC